MKEKGCIQLLQACITHCISISSQFTQKITGKVQKPILLIKAKICSVSMKYTNIHLCSLGVWSAALKKTHFWRESLPSALKSLARWTNWVSWCLVLIVSVYRNLVKHGFFICLTCDMICLDLVIKLLFRFSHMASVWFFWLFSLFLVLFICYFFSH